jgi:hypothetical protein
VPTNAGRARPCVRATHYRGLCATPLHAITRPLHEGSHDRCTVLSRFLLFGGVGVQELLLVPFGPVRLALGSKDEPYLGSLRRLLLPSGTVRPTTHPLSAETTNEFGIQFLRNVGAKLLSGAFCTNCPSF